MMGNSLLKRFFHQRRLIAANAAIDRRDFPAALRHFRKLIASQPTVSAMYNEGVRLAQADMSLSDLATALNDIRLIKDSTLREMIFELLTGPRAYVPSQFWIYFMIYNAFQIDELGNEHFKRTVNNNYFNWTGEADIAAQVAALEGVVGSNVPVFSAPMRPSNLTEQRWQAYVRFLALLYVYAKQQDELGALDLIEEPTLGDPIAIVVDGRLISQDLCNSVVDVNRLLAGRRFGRTDAITVYELGAGHGRLGAVLLKLFPRLRYVVIDIPPALHVSQWYLTALFAETPAFRFRAFSRYSEISAEFERSRLAFMLPHQVEYLPPKSANLFVNICSLQEMSRDHVKLWFSHVDRLCSGAFYSKQYLHHHNAVDGITIDRADYPELNGWSTIFDRECPSFPALFEKMSAAPGYL